MQVATSFTTVLPSCRAASLRARRSLNKSLSAQKLSWDSINGLHIHREEPVDGADKDSKQSPENKVNVDEAADQASPGDCNRHSEGEDAAAEPQPKCHICGITTTSQAHMEVRHCSQCCFPTLTGT